METDRGADIFISYSRQDGVESAEALAELLEGQGWTVWWDRKIRPGERWDDSIEAALKAARCVVVLWTEAACESNPVKNEASAALEEGKLVPVRLEEVEPPMWFKGVEYTDLVGRELETSDDEVRLFVKTIGEKLSGRLLPTQEIANVVVDKPGKLSSKSPTGWVLLTLVVVAVLLAGSLVYQRRSGGSSPAMIEPEEGHGVESMGSPGEEQTPARTREGIEDRQMARRLVRETLADLGLTGQAERFHCNSPSRVALEAARDRLSDSLILEATPLALRLRALCNVCLQEPELALEDFRSAIDLAPEDAASHYGLARFLDSSAPKRAEESYRKAIELAPDYLEPRLLLAANLRARDQAKNAETELRRAIDLEEGSDPEWAPFYRMLARLLFERGSLFEAIPAIDAAIKRDRSVADAHTERAAMKVAEALATPNLRRELAEQAVASAKESVELNPDQAEAHFHWARANFLRGKTKAAMTRLDTAIEKRPNDPRFLFYQARYHEEAESLESSINVWLELGELCSSERQTKTAELAYQQADRLRLNSGPADSTLAVDLFEACRARTGGPS